MRTTIDLPEELINEAMKTSGATTKNQLIKTALEEMIERRKRLKLLSFKGKIDVDINLNAIRDRNR